MSLQILANCVVEFETVFFTPPLLPHSKWNETYKGIYIQQNL